MTTTTSSQVRTWSRRELLDLGEQYQGAAILLAACELEVFSALAQRPLDAAELAGQRKLNVRAATCLLDALAALGLLEKDQLRYSLAEGVGELLGGGGRSVLPILQHQANCLRCWAALPEVVRSGKRHEAPPSTRGDAADLQAFIHGMAVVSAPVMERVFDELRPLRFEHLLDVGGANGAWVAAFLREVPSARATLFDQPDVIGMAEGFLRRQGLLERVKLVGGDFDYDELPGPADLAWLSAIAHMNSRQENRELFAKIARALGPKGRLILRDVVMEEGRTRPTFGATFAIHMLVQTPSGGTYTFGEYRADLLAAGFVSATLLRQGEEMDSLIEARKG